MYEFTNSEKPSAFTFSMFKIIYALILLTDEQSKRSSKQALIGL